MVMPLGWFISWLLLGCVLWVYLLFAMWIGVASLVVLGV